MRWAFRLCLREGFGGTWRFSERVIRHTSLDGVHRDFIGDMSRHTRND